MLFHTLIVLNNLKHKSVIIIGCRFHYLQSLTVCPTPGYALIFCDIISTRIDGFALRPELPVHQLET